jgi:hypothetical protein
VWTVESEKWFAPAQDLSGQRFDLAGGVGVGDQDGAGEGGDEFISLRGQRGGNPVLLCSKGGYQQKPAFADGIPPVGGHTHALKRAGGTDYDRLGATEQEAKALALDGRMKPADYRYAGIAERGRGVAGLDNQIAGASFRAEQREQRLSEGISMSKRKATSRRVVAKHLE